MSTLQEKAAQAADKMQKENPAATPEKGFKRIPLSVPQRKLEVPEIPGYHCRWFRGTQTRIAQALQAGYEYVAPEEVKLNNLSLGGDASKTGNTDMGSRVSVVEGGETEGGQAVRLYLMKQKLEYKHEDDAVLAKRNDSVVAALTTGFRQGTLGAEGARAQGETEEDFAQRYVDKKRSKIPDLFRRKVPKVRPG